MKTLSYIKHIFTTTLLATTVVSCNLDAPLENEQIVEEIDYSQSQNMVQMLYGAYGELYDLPWEVHATVGVRGDDVNAAGDQSALQMTDAFRYDRIFWFYNGAWNRLYSDLIYWHGAIESIRNYQEAGANEADAERYIAEIKVMQGFKLLQLARLWGDILIPHSSAPSDLFDVELSSFEEVMHHISTLMDEAIPFLDHARPNQRTDIRGGITAYTAYAVKAMANLEAHDYQAAADATGEIIGSGLFHLAEDYYQLFNIPGKLHDEKLLELQYSDYGTATGTQNRGAFVVYGPQAASWTPAVSGSGGGWGFWEPTMKYVKFMLDRNEETRLPVSVLFTPAGIAAIQSDPDYADLPDWVTNVTPDNDVFLNSTRYQFLSGKHYLPTTQLTPGRIDYGENNNWSVIRYAEVLLMHAEALVSGASSSVMSADEAVNQVRLRANLTALNDVTIDDVLDEKYAELAMEWGHRFYDLVRHGRHEELSHEGKIYQPDVHRFLPYPLEQVDILPQLREVEFE